MKLNYRLMIAVAQIVAAISSLNAAECEVACESSFKQMNTSTMGKGFKGGLLEKETLFLGGQRQVAVIFSERLQEKLKDKDSDSGELAQKISNILEELKKYSIPENVKSVSLILHNEKIYVQANAPI